MTEAIAPPAALEVFNESYFMRGKETGVSNYQNYTWRPEITMPCAERMARFLGCRPGDSILDYGCSRGYYVRALRLLGYFATGFDISKWAIENCDPTVSNFVKNELPEEHPDWIICKDVLEHICGPNLESTIQTFLQIAQKGILIIVPLRAELTCRAGRCEKAKFVAPQDNEDKTHVSCFTLPAWLHILQKLCDATSEWAVQGGYRLPGVKQACDPYPKSVGFFTLRRCQEL